MPISLKEAKDLVQNYMIYKPIPTVIDIIKMVRMVPTGDDVQVKLDDVEDKLDEVEDDLAEAHFIREKLEEKLAVVQAERDVLHNTLSNLMKIVGDKLGEKD